MQLTRQFTALTLFNPLSSLRNGGHFCFIDEEIKVQELDFLWSI